LKKLAILFLLLFSCSGNGSKVCTPETPLVKVGDRVITVGYYEKVREGLPTPLRKKFHSGRELLKNIVDRQLILLDSLERGIFEKPEIKEKVERFKIGHLAYRFLNSKVGDFSVSDREVEEFIKKHYAKKEVTPQLKRKVKANLEARKFQKERQKVIDRAKAEVSFVNKKATSPDDPVALYKGEKIYLKDLLPLLGKSPTPKRLERAVLEYVLYRKALEEGLEKGEDFQASYNRFLSDIAVEEFRKRVLSSVKVTDEEVKDYYEKHKGIFRRPPSAEVVIYEFDSKEKAERALKAGKLPADILKKGKSWKVTAEDVNDNPVSALVFKEGKDRGIVPLPDGRALLVLVKKRFPERELLYGDAYPLIKRELTAQRAEKIAREELKRLKEKFGVTYYEGNLDCISP